MKKAGAIPRVVLFPESQKQEIIGLGIGGDVCGLRVEFGDIEPDRLYLFQEMDWRRIQGA